MDYNLNQETYTTEEVRTLLDKFAKSEADQVRTEYSKRLKAVEAERDALKPAEKTEAELALETRAAELSRRERALACKENGISAEFVDLLREDADLSKLGELLWAGGGYVPRGHKSGGMTREAFQAMSYSEQAAFYNENPDFLKNFI